MVELAKSSAGFRRFLVVCWPMAVIKVADIRENPSEAPFWNIVESRAWYLPNGIHIIEVSCWLILPPAG